jgi:hypothetical protein
MTQHNAEKFQHPKKSEKKSQKRGDVNGRLSTFNDGEANLDSHQTQSAPDEFYRNFFPITALFFFVSLTDVLQ